MFLRSACFLDEGFFFLVQYNYVFLLLCLCILIVMYVLFCIFCFHRANWHSLAILTEVFRAFSSVVTRKDGARPALFPIRQ